MEILPPTRPVARWLLLLRLAWLVNAAYQIVARLRPWLGRLLPDAPVTRRFP